MRSALTISRFLAVLSACIALAAYPAASAQSPAWPSAARRPVTVSGPEAPVARTALARQDALGPVAPPARPSGGQLPQDPSLEPLLKEVMAETVSEMERRSQVTPGVLERLQLVTDSFERSRALLELAAEASKSTELRELLLAHRALEQASLAAMSEGNRLRHDQLLAAVIRATEPLTDALIREGFTLPARGNETRPAPFPGIEDVTSLPRLARLDWRRASFLADRIINPTYRNEYKARVSEWMSRDSAHITENMRRNESAADRLPDARILNPQEVSDLKRLADGFLTEAAGIAIRIERPIWKHSALNRIAITAGESGQYATGAEVARSIPNAEARAQALILVAESQCRHGLNEEATASYSDAAIAVSRIERDGLRGVLAGYLVDSLISTGRFDDARSCLVLYPTEAERFVALGAIAESQGRRGSAAAAREWIVRDVPPAYRSALFRRVNSGVLTAIGNERQNRTRVMSPRSTPE